MLHNESKGTSKNAYMRVWRVCIPDIFVYVNMRACRKRGPMSNGGRVEISLFK